ncbi:MAG: hypothetical protein EOO38_08335 [Cytophagaceae bacterium]|nr:MAG: hypothetical protein EOO38_08335 [Cytophagaceae bacterium]
MFCLYTLVVPGFNDKLAGLRSLARELVSLHREVPWHLNGFLPRHRMQHLEPTTPTLPTMLAGSGYAQGLRYVYVGNFGKAVPHLFDTRCASCHKTLIRRED